ncbi:MAG: YicC family protein [Chlorobi bacterium]|nr:MAG: stress-induced protein [Chlorobi bacterium OLB7]MBK8912189.1 YicC family protein [Chlorobiota bacterium]MBX7215908.1 YicC family protein [Candidatus Kapabacteria bacterium]
MTGYGRSERSRDGVSVSVELRSLNSRFLEVITRTPRDLNPRENDIREIVRKIVNRGKINVSVNVEREQKATTGLKVDPDTVVAYKDALEQIKKAAKLKDTVSLDHLLQFRDLLIQPASEVSEDVQWELVAQAVEEAARALDTMRRNEGSELSRDITDRVASIGKMVDSVEKISREKIPQERQRLRERIAQLFENDEIDEQRLEFEIVILAEKLDVTEECVRFRSHAKFFMEAVNGPEPAGRKLGFLLQEMNREVTTIGSKSNDSEIAHLVVRAKEELEKIREQVQNIE